MKCMKVIKEWKKDGVPHRLIHNEDTLSPDKEYQVQSKREKNWSSFSPWYGLQILGEHLKNEHV